MTAIRELMTGLIDYAGLFPPAKLAMHLVVENYDRYLAGDYAWIMGRLICPAARLDEMAECIQALPPAPADREPWRISMLGRPAADGDVFTAQLADDIAAARACENRLGSAVVVDAYEVRVPDRMAGQPDGLGDLARSSRDRLVSELGRDVRVFFEVPFAENWTTQVPAAIAQFATRASDSPSVATEGGCGVKVRTGGVEAHMIPGVEQVACFIAACCKHKVAFKATAGLHHPIRHPSDQVAAPMHGFFNVFGGAVLAQHAGLDESTLSQILDDRDASHFVWSEDGLAWRDTRVDASRIAATRATLATSFGSCSFDEPIDDLRSMALL